MAIRLDQNFNIVSPLTAFGDLTVAQKEPVIQLIFSHGLNSKQVATTVTGSGTSAVTNGLAVVSTTTATGTAKLSSNKRVYYSAGAGIEAIFTCVFDTQTATNAIQKIGLYSTSDGFAFAYQNNVLGVLHRTSTSGSVVNNFIPQSSWNVDKCDGTGASQFTIDPSKGNVYRLQKQYVGFGDIFFYIENPETGLFILCHIIKFANSSTVQSVRFPYYTMNIEVDNAASAKALSTKTACMVASNENINSFQGIWNSVTSYKTAITTRTALWGLQNLSSVNGVTNNIIARIRQLQVNTFNTGNSNSDVLFELLLNPAVSGSPTWTSLDSSSTSVLNKNTNITTITAVNTIMWRGRLMSTSGGLTWEYDLDKYGLEMAPNDTVYLCATGSASVNVGSVANVEEMW